MATKFHGSFPGTPDSVARIRHAISEVARDCGLSAERVHEVRLAVSEAVSNAVVHAYRERAGEIVVAAEQRDGELVVTVGDQGGGLVPRPDSPGLGLGLPLIVALTKRMEICDGDSGETEVMMAFDCR